MLDKSSAEILKRIKELHCAPVYSENELRSKDKSVRELIGRLEFSLNAVADPLPNQGAFMAEHLQKLIAAIESEKPGENLTRSVSEAKAALSLYRVTL